MGDVWGKLNWKGHDPVVVIGAPASFEPDVAALGATVHRDWVDGVTFAVGFGTTLADVAAFAAGASRTAGDVVVWFAYPKGSSKRYTCAFNRDTGWQALGDVGFEPVRQIAIDEDWSALRFRRVAFIARMTRSFAMTAEGKRRAGKA